MKRMSHGWLKGVGLLLLAVASASVFAQSKLITNQLLDRSVLPPHARLLAGKPGQNEFYILSGERANIAPTTTAASVQQAQIKRAFAHATLNPNHKAPSSVAMQHIKNNVGYQKAHRVAMKKDVVKIEMAFKRNLSKRSVALTSSKKKLASTKTLTRKTMG